MRRLLLALAVLATSGQVAAAQTPSTIAWVLTTEHAGGTAEVETVSNGVVACTAWAVVGSERTCQATFSRATSQAIRLRVTVPGCPYTSCVTPWSTAVTAPAVPPGSSTAAYTITFAQPLPAFPPMAAPTLSNYQQSTWSDLGTSPETTASVTWSAGDRVVVVGMTEGNTMTLNTPTWSDSATFSALAGTPTNTASKCKGYAWSAVANGSGSGAISATTDGAGKARGIAAFVFSGSTGIGNVSVSASLGSTTTQSLTRSGANSAVVQVWGDFAAVNDTTVTWTPSGETQRVAQFVSGAATFFVANWGDQGGTGTTSYGFSGFAGGNMTAITVEVLGSGSAAASLPPMRPRAGMHPALMVQ